MIINNYNSITKITKCGDKITNYKDLYIPDDYLSDMESRIYMADGKYYFCKCSSYIDKNKSRCYFILNEIIGRYLSDVLDIPSCDYRFGIFDKFLYAISEVFYKKKYIYYNCYQYYKTDAYNELSNLKGEYDKEYFLYDNILELVDNPIMLNKLLKLIAIDFKMGQEDRHSSNVILMKKRNSDLLDIAPLFDFEDSLVDDPNYYSELFYENPFLIIRKNEKSMKDFVKKYPEIYKYVYTLVNTSILDILQQIESDYNVSFDNSEYEHFKIVDNNNTKVLKKFL